MDFVNRVAQSIVAVVAAITASLVIRVPSLNEGDPSTEPEKKTGKNQQTRIAEQGQNISLQLPPHSSIHGTTASEKILTVRNKAPENITRIQAVKNTNPPGESHLNNAATSSTVAARSGRPVRNNSTASKKTTSKASAKKLLEEANEVACKCSVPSEAPGQLVQPSSSILPEFEDNVPRRLSEQRKSYHQLTRGKGLRQRRGLYLQSASQSSQNVTGDGK